MKFILASASPRRKELLSSIVPSFEVIPAKGEEIADARLTPEETVCALARAKCDEVFSRNADSLVIAGDTIVVLGDKILGKPKDEEDARRTLGALSGKTHRVITGVSVRSPKGARTDFAVTEVRFNKLTEEFIDNYVKSGSPMDKAGSYGIQDGGLVATYSGSYENVIGLPVELTAQLIKEVL